MITAAEIDVGIVGSAELVVAVVGFVVTPALHLVADAAAEFVESIDRAAGERDGVVVVFGGVTVVWPAFEAAAELAGLVTVTVRAGVLDVALLRGHVAARWVLAVPIAHLDGTTHGTDERALCDTATTDVRPSNNTDSMSASPRYRTS